MSFSSKFLCLASEEEAVEENRLMAAVRPNTKRSFVVSLSDVFYWQDRLLSWRPVSREVIDRRLLLCTFSFHGSLIFSCLYVLIRFDWSVCFYFLCFFLLLFPKQALLMLANLFMMPKNLLGKLEKNLNQWFSDVYHWMDQ